MMNETQVQEQIVVQAVESARELLAQGWSSADGGYDLGTYSGDREALEERIGRPADSYERGELERQIRGYLADPSSLPAAPRKPARVTITLTAYNMGPETTEEDFDAWTRYVDEHLVSALGLDGVELEVEQFSFPGGPERDTIDCNDDETYAAIRTWLSVDGWDAFCSAHGEGLATAETAPTDPAPAPPVDEEPLRVGLHGAGVPMETMAAAAVVTCADCGAVLKNRRGPASPKGKCPAAPEEPAVKPNGWTGLVGGGFVLCEGGEPKMISDGGAPHAGSAEEAKAETPSEAELLEAAEDLLSRWLDYTGEWEPGPDEVPYEAVRGVKLSAEQPTHRITFKATSGAVTTWLVMLRGGAEVRTGVAYDHNELRRYHSGSWTVCDGVWLCEGQAAPGGEVGTVEVEVIERESAEG